MNNLPQQLRMITSRMTARGGTSIQRNLHATSRCQMETPGFALRGSEPQQQQGMALPLLAVAAYLGSIPALVFWAEARHRSLVTEKSIDEEAEHDYFEDIAMAINY
uniref:Uncharacterized protein n=1 Tax=Leptocylindrus danicus TaxID=163516 RepID=A0A7S2KE59_9STRA|mmetsp:Transcript_21690/g.32384  ORF Transcript_21690/g.32384 Transcript_21690/m.32384 type:complete len:106 (+) Transcript_21690:159-476(+)|eukprot:CAMPEP_0116025986 /NCGR_PEP_ID=MMETSP0321-20121206/13498_1 /TAXON_ID=163516 /ORGANISM="Leptocylindrus danicus var. danicus, Strain B650" /LENGTH=105 /DNA_ID=CAMNT_0003498531 /DNA_START=131 /DNA_END=448 /DNA_ORIENTATION=+